MSELRQWNGVTWVPVTDEGHRNDNGDPHDQYLLKADGAVCLTFAVDLSSGNPVVVTHNLGSKTCVVQVWVGDEKINVDVYNLTTTTVTVHGSVNPALAASRVIVSGLRV